MHAMRLRTSRPQARPLGAHGTHQCVVYAALYICTSNRGKSEGMLEECTLVMPSRACTLSPRQHEMQCRGKQTREGLVLRSLGRAGADHGEENYLRARRLEAEIPAPVLPGLTRGNGHMEMGLMGEGEMLGAQPTSSRGSASAPSSFCGAWIPVPALS